MIQQKETHKITYHFIHLQNILTNVLRQTAAKYQNLMLTKRTEQIVYSMLSEAQIIACGFKKIILPSMINPYMNYEDVTLVLTLSGPEDYQQVSQIGRQIDKVHIVHLGICTQQGKTVLKKIQFKQTNSIKGFKQQNLDFFCYLQNTFLLTTKKQKKGKQKNNNKNKQIANPHLRISQQTAIDRLCSVLFSYQTFSEFQFYYPKKRQELAKVIKQTMQAKLAILSKYNYKGITKNQGMSAVKTKVIILERSEQVSPYILSLCYGPLTEELGIGNSCRLASTHSLIYNSLYHLDILSAGNELTRLAEDLSGGKQKKLNSVNLTQAKKVLQKAYNPNMSKQQIQFHQTLLKSINQFMADNIQLLALQQSIGNKIDENGQKMKGGIIVQSIMKWCQQANNQNRYQRYLGLILLALTVQSFWWYQKNQLVSGVADKDDREAIEKYIKKCKQKYKTHHLQQKIPKKDQDGAQLRQKCFRHEPNILKSFIKIEQEIKQNKLIDYEIMKINQSDIEKAGKKIRTIVYINDVIGYNELSMLLALKRPDIQFIIKDTKNTKEWIEMQLNNP